MLNQRSQSRDYALPSTARRAQMYDNIASLRFDVAAGGEMAAGALVSAEGEVMELRKPVAAEGRVEDWMTGVLLEMRRTNHLITKEAIFHYGEDRSRWAPHEATISLVMQ